eukprot:TRINITY_DN43638_c0_g1_i1.p1 TRINITY_DN43638_c0_g1~~TRINITY_DN43638_c0_g1_i1.p1  ORF type:complete len:322 (-),score=60.55 TRINITY_DN43638_c0_g1_i1:127-1092(-)
MAGLTKKHKARLIKVPGPARSLGRRSHARQMGTQAAKGEVLLYLDGDMVVGPGYIAELKRLHSLYPQIMLKGDRFSLAQGAGDGDPGLILGKASQRHNQEPMPEDLYRSGRRWSWLPRDLALVSGSLLAGGGSSLCRRRWLRLCGLGLVGLALQASLPTVASSSWANRWDYCASNNLSVRRAHALRIGGWDCTFMGWGEEDMDFAYRLFLQGLRPMLPTSGPLYAYHLDHPVDQELNRVQLARNARYFTRKFPEMTLLRKESYDYYGLKAEDYESSSQPAPYWLQGPQFLPPPPLGVLHSGLVGHLRHCLCVARHQLRHPV